MAKPVTQKVKLLSTAGTGFFYVTKKNPRTSTEKIVFKKYDPIARKHVACTRSSATSRALDNTSAYRQRRASEGSSPART